MATASDSPTVLIGMPVFRGRELVPESLRSILDQTFGDYRVLVSIDGQDEDSAAACKQFTSDPRISFTVQENRLGWASNLNWLMERCDAPFFCYWQQDDICATNYLSSLHACAIANPGAACCYSDIQWFGGLFGRESLPSITGTPLNRVLMQVEKGHFAPFRGLVRQDALHAAGCVRLTSYDSRLEDLVWVAKLARYGDLIRVPDTLYFKRVHRSNAHSSGKSLPDEYRRSVWIEYGLGMIEAALPLVNSVPEQLRLFETVLERILVPRDGRWVFFDPVRDGSASAVSFANDFLDAVLRRFGAEPWSHAARLPDPRAALALVSAHAARVDPASADAVLTGLGLRASRLEELSLQAAAHGCLDVRFGCGEVGGSLLESGWSTPEPWGVWSGGKRAELRLPIPDSGSWKVHLEGHGFNQGARGSRRVANVRLGDRVLTTWMFTSDAAAIADSFVVTADGGSGCLLTFDLPDAASPADLGISEDSRVLGVALIRLRLTREDCAD